MSEVKESQIPSGMDAREWAAAFCAVNPPTDEGTMLGWFANAIMAGYDEARRRYEAPASPDPVTTDEAYERALREWGESSDGSELSWAAFLAGVEFGRLTRIK